MGKRADDLPFDDTPITPTPPEQQDLFEPTDKSTAGDDAETPWYQFVGRIDDLLGSGEYDWASDTLTGISETVQATHRVSEGQRRAVANIEARGESRRDDGGRARRYEGFDWRGR